MTGQMPNALRVLCALALLALPALPARAFDTSATAAYVLDMTSGGTGTVLLEKNARTPLPPASMSKLMTLYMLFEALQDGRVSMDTRFGVSARAEAVRGSSMFLNTRDRPTVEELIQGIIVQSGNDACVVVAEGLAGTEEAFAGMMNARARDLGMMESSFANASGWPHPNQRMSMHDLALLATHLITRFPEYYGFFAQQEFGFDGRVPDNSRNRNPLLSLGIGADGLKTGHTSEAGYGLVGSATDGGRRIVFVVAGLDTKAERREESERIINWAFRQFSQRKVLSEGEQVAVAEVWMGAASSVGLVAPQDYALLVPALIRGEVTGEVHHMSPVEAPITRGQQIAELVIAFEGLPELRLPLVADRDVPRGGFLPRVSTAAKVLMRGVARRTPDLF